MHSLYFFALFSPNDLSGPRVGITVSRKVGGAVVRNRIKRLVREFFRKRAGDLGLGNLDMNIIAKKGVGEESSEVIFSSLNELFEKIARKSRV